MYRTVDTGTWTDEWIQSLPPHARYLFLYLLTNHRATACGAFELTLTMAARETGLTPGEVQAALVALAPKVAWWPELETVWVRNFYRKQRANSNGENFTKSARTALKMFNAGVQQAVIRTYPELRSDAPPPPHPTEDRPAQPYNNGIDHAMPEPMPEPIRHKENSKQITDNRDQEQRENVALRARTPTSVALVIPPGTPVNRRPDAPPLLPKPSEDPDVLAFVEELAAHYPHRDTKFRSPKKAHEAVAGVSRDRWPLLLVGADFYAESVDAADGKTKDLHNWINDGDCWQWAQGPARPRPSKNGASHAPTQRPAGYAERERAALDGADDLISRLRAVASGQGDPAGRYGGIDQDDPPGGEPAPARREIIDGQSRRLGPGA